MKISKGNFRKFMGPKVIESQTHQKNPTYEDSPKPFRDSQVNPIFTFLPKSKMSLFFQLFLPLFVPLIKFLLNKIFDSNSQKFKKHIMMKAKVQKGGKLRAQIQQKHKTNEKGNTKQERMCKVEKKSNNKKKEIFFEGFLGVFRRYF